MAKINSQAKGKRAEREVAKLINKYLGTNVRRTPQSGGLSIKGAIIDIDPNKHPFTINNNIITPKRITRVSPFFIFFKFLRI